MTSSSVIGYLTGTPGQGKTAYTVREISRALLSGRVVVGNVGLVDDWYARMARHNPWALRASTRRAVALDLLTRFHYSDDLQELVRCKLFGRGESRGLLVLDEAHNNLNNREWASKESRDFLKWVSSVRHKGWRVLCVSQHADNTDAALRRIADQEIRMVNYKKLLRIPVVGAELLPVPVFRATHFPLNLPPGAIARNARRYRETFVLGWWKRLYDTHELRDVDEPGAIWLPKSVDDVHAELAASGRSL
jgi:hypothetical protein